MRLHMTLALTALSCAFAMASSCEVGESSYGCKVAGNSCTCGYGCRSDYAFRTKTSCMNSLQEKSSDICSRSPCMRGICTQTLKYPGYACKCDGTGFYGQQCEKECPQFPMRGLVFPHECVVI